MSHFTKSVKYYILIGLLLCMPQMVLASNEGLSSLGEGFLNLILLVIFFIVNAVMSGIVSSNKRQPSARTLKVVTGLNLLFSIKCFYSAATANNSYSDSYKSVSFFFGVLALLLAGYYVLLLRGKIKS